MSARPVAQNQIDRARWLGVRGIIERLAPPL